MPDPNRFDGTVLLRRPSRLASEWEELAGERRLPRRGPRVRAGRSRAALAPDAEPRASGTLALHVLDVMESLLTAAVDGRTVAVSSSAERPEPVPLTDLAVTG